MNETVTIKEGGLTRRLAPIDKLKVNTTDNKDSTWVSAGKANTGVLHASENGIYIASEDGYEAYSEVIVRVTKDSFEGDTSFDDWDYETPDMDLDNWDPETIEDFELDPDGFDDTFNNEDEWKDIDKPIDIKMDNPKIQDTKISGIDPVTGNEMEVGLDADGYLTESTLPSSIKIVVPPDKHQYVDGQPILFRGMVVKAYTADGELWTDISHPDGIIPHSELTFPVTQANISEASEDTYTASTADGTVQYLPSENASFVFTNTPGSPDSQEYNYDFDSGFKFVTYDGKALCAGPRTVLHYTAKTTLYGEYRSTNNLGGGSYKVNYFNYNGFGDAINAQMPQYLPQYTGDLALEDVIDILLHGEIKKEKGTQTIPVQYIRSDGEVLEDSFTIEVLPDPDGAHPQVDPSTVEWNHRKYKANEDLGAVEVRHGSVYMEGGAIYDVGAAVRLGMLEPVDNEIVP
jgi:hypothetical protein